MDDVGSVETVFDLTGLQFLNGLRNVRRDRAGLRVRHETLRTKDTTDAADDTHHIRGRNDSVEVEEVFFLDLLDKIFSADEIGTGFGRFRRFGVASKDEDTDLFARTVRQNDRTTDLLVGVTGVNTQTDVELNGFIELRLGALDHEIQRFGRFELGLLIVSFYAIKVFFASVHFCFLLKVVLRNNPPTAGTTCPASYQESFFPKASIKLVFDNDAHAAAGTRDHAHSAFHVFGVQVLHLDFRDLTDIFLADGRDLRLVRNAGAAFDVASLLNEGSSRGRLGDKGKGTVSINRYDDRDFEADVILRAFVEFLDKVRQTDTVRGQSRTDRRTCDRFAGVNLEFDNSCYFLRHGIAKPPNNLKNKNLLW